MSWSHYIRKVTSDEGVVFDVLVVYRPNRERNRDACGISYVAPEVLKRKDDPGARQILALAWRAARENVYSFLRKQARKQVRAKRALDKRAA